MKTLHITIRDKIATYMKRDGEIVCGNGDYQIEFDFDDEWDAYADKTARFIWNGQHFDQPFSGNICRVPVIKNTTSCLVGVYVEDLETTTPAQIDCLKSVLCNNTARYSESDVIYADEAQEAAKRAEDAAERAEDSLERAEEIVDSLEDGSYIESDPTVPNWAKQPAKPTYTAAEIGAAPAGFGLGTSPKILTSEDDIDKIWNNGWYTWTTRVPQNAPSVASGVTTYGYLFVNGITQSIASVHAGVNNVILTRSKIGGDIGAWEWVNPPMQLGVEYRTTERYMGKPVYVKLVDCGNLPNSSTKGITVATSKKAIVTEIKGLCIKSFTEGIDYYDIYGIDGISKFGTYASNVDSINIAIHTTNDLSTYQCYATIKYTLD
jgi:hypothetical protein